MTPAIVRTVSPRLLAGVVVASLLAAQRAPFTLVANRGQWPDPVRFQTHAGNTATWLTDTGLVLTLERPTGAMPIAPARAPLGAFPTDVTAPDQAEGVALRLMFVGARAAALEAEQELSGRRHWLLGNDQRRWVRDVRGFARVRYRNVWRGVDVVVREGAGVVEYDLEAAPGADLQQVALRWEGADGVHLDAQGRLHLTTPLGELVQSEAMTWSTDGLGSKHSHPSRCVVRGDGTFGFAVDGWDGAQRLTIDPGLAWSTYVGGGADELLQGLDVQASGAVAVCGWSLSINFPTSIGAYRRILGGTQDAVVARYQPDGSTLRFATYFGGAAGWESAWDVAVDANDRTWFGGATASWDLPVTVNAAQPLFGGVADAMVACLDATGGGLWYSSFFGGSANEGCQAFHLDAAGVITLGGWTSSTNLPCTGNAFQAALGGIGAGGMGDGWVAQFTSLGQRVYSSYFGGNLDDYVSGVHGSGVGMVTLALGTFSTDLPPSANAFQSAFGGGNPANSASGDVFLAQLAGNTQAYGSYFGRLGNEWPFAVQVDARGRIVFGGGGGTVPTTPGAWRTAYQGGGADGYVSCLDPVLPPALQLVYSTFVGGSGYDNGLRLTLAPNGDAVLCGVTRSLNLVTTPGAFAATFGGGTDDGFVTRLRMDVNLQPPSRQLIYESHVSAANSTSNDSAWKAIATADGVLTVTGATQAMPTAYGGQPAAGGGQDGYVLRVVTPPGLGAFGTGCGPAPGRLLADPLQLPVLGALFQVDLVGFQPVQPGLMLLAGGRFATGVPLTAAGLTGCQLYLLPLLTVPLATDAGGYAAFVVPIPPDPALLAGELFLQALVGHPGANATGFVTTHGALGMIGQ